MVILPKHPSTAAETVILSILNRILQKTSTPSQHDPFAWVIFCATKNEA